MRLIEKVSEGTFPSYGSKLKDWKYYDVFANTLKKLGYRENQNNDYHWWKTFPDDEIVLPSDASPDDEDAFREAEDETIDDYIGELSEVLAEALYNAGMPYDDAYSENETWFLEELESIGVLEIFPESELAK